MYWIEDGCPNTGTGGNGSWQTKSALISITCCTYDGSKCDSVGYCIYNKSSYDDAVATCAENNQRLCTKEELVGGVCCGVEGDCDHYTVWTSTPRSGGT